ncbi:YceI family protein [Streptomyces pseudovenezuelae]|uniref:Polyisoprenoid-binding protein YceI n=1 Tax=Streptomyces pseudovenezuelae TaxID=67350 RepID=A0ABT6LLV6_9ACTN|nr:YceI family protein [Streptomyces pseudovenezuelae]MDH6217292.1 polyisoprenoid-binding protein YceI [Streptomyces pseudovenezuelae]
MNELSQQTALTGDYVLDTARTRIGFVSRAVLISKVRGRFEEFEGSAHLDGEDPSKSEVRLTIRTRGLQTGNARRDEHLRGADFLDGDHHPDITFTSTRVRQTGATRFTLTGDLTVRGTTRPVTVDLEVTDTGSGVSFTGRGTLNRRDWDVSWGGRLLADKVTLELEVALIHYAQR